MSYYHQLPFQPAVDYYQQGQQVPFQPEVDYRQQGQQGQQFFPGFPGGGVNQRLERLERQIERLDRRMDQTDRRLDRIERRLGLRQEEY